MQLFIHTLTTAVKYGIYLAKLNQNVSKNCKIEQLDRIILNLSNDVHHTIALHALGWEPLQTERKKAKAKMMYKVLNKKGPKSLTNLFSYKSEKTNYHLRDISSSLCLPKPRTNNMKKSFMYDGAHLWNSIPKEIRERKSLSSFRNKIAAHIIA